MPYRKHFFLITKKYWCFVVYCGVENPVPCGGTFIVATAELTLLPLLFLVILCISIPELSVLALLAFNSAEP